MDSCICMYGRAMVGERRWRVVKGWQLRMVLACVCARPGVMTLPPHPCPLYPALHPYGMPYPLLYAPCPALAPSAPALATSAPPPPTYTLPSRCTPWFTSVRLLRSAWQGACSLYA